MKKRYRGRFNVAGEVHEFWGWYSTEAEATTKLKRKLEEKVQRKVFLDSIDHYIDQVGKKDGDK